MPPAPNRLAVNVRAWAEFAADDRQTLRLIEQAGGPPRTAAFHAQQAVEKLLKAVLISYGVEPEDTHGIGSLVTQLHRLDRRLADSLGNVSALTPYAVLMRYPPRPDRYGRTLDAVKVAEDLAVAHTACDKLESAVRDRVAQIDPPGTPEAGDSPSRMR